MPENNEVLLDIREGVAVITLNRPDQHNTLTAGMIKSLGEGGVDWVERRPPRWTGSVNDDWPDWME